MTTKERLAKLIERLPEDEARELDVLLAWRDEQRAWDEVALAAFAAHFDEGEIEYTIEDAGPGRYLARKSFPSGRRFRRRVGLGYRHAAVTLPHAPAS